MKFRFSIRRKLLAYFSGLAVIFLILILIYSSTTLKKNRISNKKNEIALITKSQAVKLNALLSDAYNKSVSLSHVFEGLNNNTTPDQLVSSFNGILSSYVKKNEQVHGAWVSWELEFVNDTWEKPYGRTKNYFYKAEGSIKNLMEYLDTLDEDTESIYYKLKISGKPRLIKPGETIFDATSKSEDVFCYAVPIYKNAKFVGAMGVEIPVKNLNQVFSVDKSADEVTMIITDKGEIIAHSKRNVFKDISEVINYEEDNKYIINNIKAGNVISYVKDQVVFSVFPTNVESLEIPWAIIDINPIHEVYSSAKKTTLNILIISAIVILLFELIIYFISGSFTKPLSKTSKLLKSLALGDIDDAIKLSVDTTDEIGQISESVNSLIDGLNLTARFAEEIGKGRLDAGYEKLSNKDKLGVSLINMRESLLHAQKEEEKRKIEDAKQNWSTEGIAKFGDILRQSADNLEEFGYNIISNLVKYVDANQGGIFIINEDENNEKSIDLISCYAFNRKKYLEKKIRFGEGLIGRCVLEAETIHLTEIPNDYITITSGLGNETPRSLLIVPLLLNEQVYGVIELASFKDFEDYKISFVEKIGESIASTISSVKINIRTAKLLEESKHQAEELASQEEEMRQNLEELQATQEESARKEAEMSGILSAMNASLLVAEFDMEGNIISANSSFANVFGIPRDQIVTRSYKQIAGTSGVEPEKIDIIWNSVKSNEIVKNITKLTVNNEEIWLNQTYAPILNNDGRAYKVLNIAIDVTENKKQEIQLEKILLESQQKNEELKKLKEEDERKTKEMLDTIESHQKTLVDILDQIPGKVFLKDKDGKMVLVNTQVLKTHNCSAEELLGKSDLDFFADDPELAKKLWEEEQNIIKSGKAKHFEQKEFVNNMDQYLKTVKMPFFIHYMNQTGLLGIQFDITDVKQLQLEITKQNEELIKAKEEIEKEKALMDCMMENIPDSIYFKDLESKFLRVSNNMLSLFNASDFSQVAGKSDFDFFSIEHAQQAFDDEQNIIKTGKPIIGLVEKESFDDGTENWVDTTKMPLLDNNGKIIGTFGISRNVTKIKKMEIEANKLIGEQKNIMPIIDGFTLNLPVLIYNIDSKKNIKEIKGAGLKLLNLNIEKIVGKPIDKLFSELKDKVITGSDKQVTFITKGKDFELKHFIFKDNVIEDGMIGYAYQTKLI